MAVKKTAPKKEATLKVDKPSKIVGGTVKKEFKTLNEALFAFQGECPVIPRNGQGNINGRDYRYATLDDVISFTRPVLQNTGLMITQPMTGDILTTEIVHIASGEKVVSTLPLGKPERSQDLGSRITYVRRYMLASMLGLSLEPDTDAKPSMPSGLDPAAQDASKLPDPSSDIVAGRNAEMAAAQAERTNAPADDTRRTSAVSTRSEAFQKANAAIDSCMGLEALALIRANIGKSVKLTDGEKVELIVVLEAKEHALGNK